MLEYSADTMLSSRQGISVQEDKLSFISSTIQDVPLVNWPSDVSLVRSSREVNTFTPFPHLQICPSFNKGQYLWNIGADNRHVTIGNNAELWVADGVPNRDYGPNIFGLEPGREAGQYVIYTYGMIPKEHERQYALTVVKDLDGQWRLKYSNEEYHNYDWCFTCKNGTFAIQWCGMPDVKDSHFVLYFDNNQLCLTDHAPNEPLPEHYLHNFYAL